MIRFAVVGVGANVFPVHAAAIRSSGLDLVGVADIDLQAADQQAKQLGCPAFADHCELLAQTRPEAVAVLVVRVQKAVGTTARVERHDFRQCSSTCCLSSA